LLVSSVWRRRATAAAICSKSDWSSAKVIV
jgi:hypothetical protein